MKKLALLFLMLPLALNVQASDDTKEKPVQHLKIGEVTSMEKAKAIFIEKTAEIKSKKTLNPVELHEIHFITYSLEKSVAYYAKHLTGKKQQLAKELAVVVEDIHINSEDNRREKTQKHLAKYFKLADKFIANI